VAADLRSAVFVAPFFARTTVRFLDAAARLPGVRLGLVCQDPPDRLPERVRSRVAAVRRIDDGLDPASIEAAVLAISEEIGPISRILGALEQLQEPLGLVRESLGIEGSGSAVARNFRDKATMKEVLRQAGVPCARARLVESAGQVEAFAREFGFPLIAKPPAGAGARNTFRIDDTASMQEYLAALPPSPACPTLLEEFIVGDEHSFDTVSIGGKPVWHSLTHYSPGPLEVMRNPWIQWTVLLPREVDHPRYEDIRAVAFRALEALGMGTGLSHLEWFRREDGSLAVSEVAARPPGAQFTTLISYAHEMDFYSAWARVMIFEEFEPPPREYAAGIAFLRGQGRGRVVAVHGLEQAQRELGSMVVEVQLPRRGQLPASSYEGEGYVVLRDRGTTKVARGLERLVRMVQIELGDLAGTE